MVSGQGMIPVGPQDINSATTRGPTSPNPGLQHVGQSGPPPLGGSEGYELFQQPGGHMQHSGLSECQYNSYLELGQVYSLYMY